MALTLANGGIRYKLNLVSGTKDANSGVIFETGKVIEENIAILPENLKAVHEGMLAVTSGSQGTLAYIYNDFPIEVAGKSGTAEESGSRPSHTWFVGFAPYDDPEVAVAVVVERGSAGSSVAPIARDVIDAYFRIKDAMNKRIPENQLHGY